MITPFLYALISVIGVSLISLIGLFTLSFNERFFKKIVFLLVSLAVGALFGDAFIHLIPEAYANSSNIVLTSIAIIGGFLLFFIFEKFLHVHHHHSENNKYLDDCYHKEIYKKGKINPLGYMILASDSFHNFIDGIIIGISYLISIEVGLASTIAIILHEIPQEMGDFGILIHSGFTRMQALFVNFLSALFAIFGVFIVFMLGQNLETFVFWALPIAAGGFIYIAAADLVPELHKEKGILRSTIQFGAIIIGVALMLLLLLID